MVAHSSTKRVTHALTDPIPDAKPSLRLYTQAMNALVGVDRNRGHRSVFFVKPDDQCFDRVLADARKDRVLKLAKEIIRRLVTALPETRSCPCQHALKPVSYTHLTLPTKRIV